MLKRLSVALIALAASVAAFAQDAIKVEVHNIVSLDERFNVVFVIEGENSPKDFRWTPPEDFQLVWGPQKGSSTSIRMGGGKTVKTSQVTYTYILLPKKTGTFKLGVATASVKGNEIVSPDLSVEVVADSRDSSSQSGAQGGTQAAPGNSSPKARENSSSSVPGDSDIFMRFSLSKTKAVVGEPLTATLKLYQRVNIAGFENARFPTFNGFWSQETESPTNVEFHREQVGNMIYNAAVLRRYTLIPQKAGTLTIDPAELVCLVSVRSGARTGNSIFDSFFEDEYVTVRKRVVSATFNVEVSPLPHGAPASFGGGVGDYAVTASVSKDSLSTHEAASLVVTVSGTGNVSLLEAPAVTFPPDFEVYDVKSTLKADRGGTSGSKTFEYPFIPRSHGDFVIPPVKYSYYNVKTSRYNTVQTDSIRVRVGRGSNDSAPAVLQGGGPSLPGADRKGVRTLADDIRFIRLKAPVSGSGGIFFLSKGYLAAAGLLAALFAILWAGLRNLRSRRADVVRTRNRKATRMALGRLRKAKGFLDGNLYSAFYEELHRALLGYVSDKLNMDMADQTRDNIREALLGRGVDEKTADEFNALIEGCEYARYSPSGAENAMSEHFDNAVKVISAMDPMMKSPQGAKKGGAVSAVLALSLAVWGWAAASSDALAEPSKAFPDSLWKAGCEAYSEGRWADAAGAFEAVIASGNTSATAYYNAGNAYFKDGNHPRAILNYERALKADPSDADARANLDYADNFIQDKIDKVPEFFLTSFFRKVCYSMSGNTWAWLSLLFFAAALGLLLLFILSPREGARKGGFFGAICAALLLALCIWMASWQRSGSLSSDRAVVMRPVSTVRSAPSQEGAKDLFILHEGTRVKVLDSLGDWYNIALDDGRQGWISSRDMEII